jgi:hypothetical protein
MKSFEYLAVEVAQRPNAKPFYLIQATASEILEWAAVPRKKQDFQVGYQRKLDDRHQGIREFFKQSDENIVPSAVLIAVNKTVSISEVQGQVNTGGSATLPFVKRLKITVPNEKTSRDLLQDAYRQLCSRLSPKEMDFVVNSPIDQLNEHEVIDEEDSDADSPVPPDSYVAEIARELRRASESPDSIAVDRMETLLDYARLVQLPGMILDGQHRVYGAKLINEFDVRLPIVLLVDTDMAEQAFQFYVVNNKATKLTPTELRGTISTSLTSEEIERLYDRFKQAGVSADTARWTYLINNSEVSPFMGLIDFGFQKGFLKENVMFQVVSKFMRPPRTLRSVYAGVGEWDDDDYRMNLFFRFWSTVKSIYPKAWDAAVRDGGGQILMKATMLVLQGYIFSQFAADMPKRSRKGQVSPIANPEEFEQSVRDELYYLPEEFFMRKWNRTDIDTSDGRSMLNEQITKVIQGQGRNIGNMQLFKASKSDSSS